MTEEQKKAEETKQLLQRVVATPDGRAMINHLQKIFLPAPTIEHRGASEQCYLGRAEVILYLVRHSSILQS